MSYTNKERSKLAEIAIQAGDEVARMQQKISDNFKKGIEIGWKRKEDNSIVTDADMTANEMICAALQAQFPNVAIVSEENPEADNHKAKQAKERFETDPLDNTSGYVGGRDGYSINIGRVVNGVPVEGVIYFPAKKELYYTKGGKAYKEVMGGATSEISVSPVQDPLRVAVGYNEQLTSYIDPTVAKKELTFAAQMRTCKIATGECDISGINKGAGGFNTYDIAGPHAVLLAAGGDIVQASDGKPFRYNGESLKVPDHIVGSQAALIRHVSGYKPERADIRLT